MIIPTYNEEDAIGECLASLSNQTYKDMEIIVVDDGSTDNTVNVVGNFQLPISNFQLLKQSHKGPGAARNLGAKHAKGEILVFVDGDMTFEDDFIEKLVTPIVKEKAKGTFSKEEYVANPDNILSQCWGINEGWEEGRRHTKNYPGTQKVFRAILKTEFDRVGGFSVTGYTDDWTLSEKFGYLAVNAPGAKFFHKNPETFGEVFKQAKWIGKREYKLGFAGKIVALARALLPISLAAGLLKALFNSKPHFIVFKLVYDFGIFLGSLSSIFSSDTAK